MAQINALSLDQAVTRGDRFFRTYAFRDSAQQPIDISTYEFKAQVRKTFSSSELTEMLVSTSASDVGNPVDTLVLVINPAETTALRPGTYVYDVQKMLTGNPNSVETFIKGTFTVEPEVTR